MSDNTRKTFIIEDLGKCTMELQAWNLLSLAFLNQGDFYSHRNSEYMSNKSIKIGREIHDKLDEIGYYD